MPAYEEAFLAVAIKNKYLTVEEAAICLNEFQAQPGGSLRLPIEEFVCRRQLLSEGQARLIAGAANKVVAQQADAPPAPAPAPSPEGTDEPAFVPGDPNEPIPGIRISGKLGVGGTATVFLADDAKNRRRVALKIVHPSLARDEKATRRFQREASLLIEFDHPNIVKGYSQGMMGPLAYCVMECLDGESAQSILERRKRFAEAQALEVILETAKAIDYMQSRGIVHRDIKPGNIMLLKPGGVKVLDLGFAQPMSAAGTAGAEEITSGTVQYMSPEQARGQRNLDVRADIYSLGASLYHMVMGELPFSGSDSLEVMAKHVMEALNSSEIKNRRISQHMHYFIERMMSKEKDLRYATPRDLIRDITERIEGARALEYRAGREEVRTSSILSTPGTPAASTPPPHKPKTERRQGPRLTTRRFSKIDDFTRRFRKK